MVDPCRYQVKIGPGCLALDFFDLILIGAKDMLRRFAAKVDVVYAFDQFGHSAPLHEFVQPAAELSGKSQLAVAKGPGSTPTGNNGTRVTAGTDTAPFHRTVPGRNIRTFLQQEDLESGL